MSHPSWTPPAIISIIQYMSQTNKVHSIVVASACSKQPISNTCRQRRKSNPDCPEPPLLLSRSSFSRWARQQAKRIQADKDEPAVREDRRWDGICMYDRSSFIAVGATPEQAQKICRPNRLFRPIVVRG
ncbi:hypothetical protein C8J56DRAFT_1048814 [Mycena floridula]|nr:hypothetical protein C8J56DRAFT_1048814 [Mycena floridula]